MSETWTFTPLADKIWGGKQKNLDQAWATAERFRDMGRKWEHPPPSPEKSKYLRHTHEKGQNI